MLVLSYAFDDFLKAYSLWIFGFGCALILATAILSIRDYCNNKKQKNSTN